MKRFFLVAVFTAQSLILNAQDTFVATTHESAPGLNSEYYQTVAADGAWCWFSDPRAVSYKGKTYAGWIDSYGSIFVGSIDHKSGEQKATCVFKYLQEDDHNNPSIYIDEDGYITLFFSKHSGKDGLYKTTSLEPESIDQWGEVEILALNDTSKSKVELSTGYTYTNATRLKSDNDNLYLFWRGMNFKPTLSISEDGGKSWSKGKIVFAPRGDGKTGRPYTKVYSDGKDKIHIAVTDGHPRNEKKNSIYYFTLRKDGYYNVKGEKIGERDDIISSKSADKVYNGASVGGKAWIWDVAQDKKGNPVIVFARYPDDKNHILCYATWSGEEWVVEDLVNSGGWFPQTPEGKKESEPNYSGGISIDKENTATVYLSVKRNGIFEIEKWTKGKKGWSIEPITSNSTKDNVRPFAIRGAEKKSDMQVMWMQNSFYHKFGSIFYPEGYCNEHYLTSIKVNREQKELKDPLDPEQVLEKMRNIVDWQTVNLNPYKGHQDRRDWIWATYYVGLWEMYKITGDVRYLSELEGVGHNAQWKIQSDYFHADRMLIADIWLSMAQESGDEKMVEDVRKVMDSYIKRGFENISLKRVKGAWKWWSWCDALYMAPVGFARAATVFNDEKYLDYMHEGWQHTADYLYSKSDSLFYRDDTFFNKKTVNDKKVFWGRGNGWVIGGLVRVMDCIPEEHPYRSYYQEQFTTMMTKIMTLQQEDGLWTASLLDPAALAMSETSGSAFYIYGLMWGINKGLLSRDYIPAALKGWEALLERVDQRGCLGYVQKVAAEPNEFKEDDWQLYASGTILLAYTEFVKLQETL